MTRYVNYDSIATCFDRLKDHQTKESEVLEAIAVTLSNNFIELVHCKECKLADRSKVKDLEIYACHLWKTPRRPNDFCSEGKPKDEVTE